MASDRQTQCNRLVATCTEDVVQDVLVRLETRTVCQDVLMKTWPQSMMMVVAPEQEEKNARAPPYTHLLKFFFKGVDGLLNQDEDPPTPLKKNLS